MAIDTWAAAGAGIASATPASAAATMIGFLISSDLLPPTNTRSRGGLRARQTPERTLTGGHRDGAGASGSRRGPRPYLVQRARAFERDAHAREHGTRGQQARGPERQAGAPDGEEPRAGAARGTRA